MNEILAKKKQYSAILKLGEKTNTADVEGDIIEKKEIPLLSEAKIKTLIPQFLGEYLQTPPQFSAKKYNGKPAYKYARKGIKVNLKPKKVVIHNLSLKVLAANKILIDVTCSSGTYIRVLGEEIAEALNSVGHLTELTRTAIGDYQLADAVSLDSLADALAEEKEFLRKEKEVKIK